MAAINVRCLEDVNLDALSVQSFGAAQKVQPWTESAEIPFWGGLSVLGVLFYPGV